MIQSPVFDLGVKSAWVIGPEGFKTAEIGFFENTYEPKKKPIRRYFAKSDSVLLLEREKQIDIIAGKDVNNDTLQNVMGYAIKQGKPLFLKRCESLSNLRIVDYTITATNNYLQLFPKVDTEVVENESDY